MVRRDKRASHRNGCLKALALIGVLALSGCSVTLNATGRWRETPVAAPDAEADRIKAVVNAMVSELSQTPNDIDAVNAVLTKYGINRKKVE